MTAVEAPRHVDLIWNMTLVCPYDCAICCVDAVHVKRKSSKITMWSNAGTTEIENDGDGGTIYEQAGRHRQGLGLELGLDGKLRVLDHLSGFAPRLDFSGGDVLVLEENLQVIEAACHRFGRHTITVTATGAGMQATCVERLGGIIGHFNFTFDSVKPAQAHRPPRYALGNLEAAVRLSRVGVRLRAEVPLTRDNCSPDELTGIYEALRAHEVEELLLMRLFPVGRGTAHRADTPSRQQYGLAIKTLRGLERRRGGPRVKLQCALRHLEFADGGSNPCNAVSQSFGVAPTGTLLRSAWAIDRRGDPLHPSWVLGNVADEPLAAIVGRASVLEMASRADENFGHCKLFAFLNGRSSDPSERFFERTDPLYS
jgi:MoaA/NifB/PqqE/SkfB family radical SAM enzyme